MAFKLRATLTNGKELEAMLQGLKQGVRNRACRKGATKAAQLLLKAVRANLRGHGFKTSSLLYKSMGTKVYVSKKNGNVIGIVGPRTGWQRTKAGAKVQTALGKKYQEAKQDPSKIAHLVEGGRKALSPVKAKALAFSVEGKALVRKAVAAAKPKPFLRPALEKNKDGVRAAFVQAVTEELAKIAAKAK